MDKQGDNDKVVRRLYSMQSLEGGPIYVHFMMMFTKLECRSESFYIHEVTNVVVHTSLWQGHIAKASYPVRRPSLRCKHR
jgi:hypothetical protein